MSILFDNATPDYLTVSSAPLTGMPMTMSCWFNCDEDGTSWQGIMSVGDAASSDCYTLILQAATANDPLRAYINAGATQTYASINGTTFNTWNHGAAIYENSTSRYVFLNGSKSAQGVTIASPVNANLTRVGTKARSGVISTVFSGNVAEIGIWNVALTDEEISMLAEGYSPLLIRPQNLVFYLPLIRDNHDDLIGGLQLTEGGTPTIGTHPRVRYPGAPYIPHIISAAAGGNVPMGALYGCLGGCLGRVG